MALGEQDVVGLDVAVDDAVPVGVGEGVDHLAQDAHRLDDGQLAFARELEPERLARDERHDVVEQVAGRSGREQRNDVRVLQAGGELDLPLESLDVHRSAHLGRQELDDDLTTEPDLFGQEDAAHAAATQLLQDAVVVADRGLKPVLEIDRSAPVRECGKARGTL